MKKTVIKLLTVVTVLALGFVLTRPVSADSAQDQAIAKIKKAGVLKVGVKQDVPNFGYYNAAKEEYQGMEIDIAKKIAKQLGVKTQFTAVTPQTREAMLDNGQIDLLIATYTITDTRKASYAISNPYYTDEIGFLTSTAASIKNIKGLNGKTIGVTQGSTTKAAIQAYGKAHGLHFKFVELGTYSELAVSLYAHRIDAVSTDKAILTGYVSKNAHILKQGFNTEDYGIAAKKSNSGLITYVNGLLSEWQSDGSLQKIYQTYHLTPATSTSN